MASAHYTRDHVGVVIPRIDSLGSIPYQPFRNLGISLIWLWASDPDATDARRREVVGQGFRCGLGYPASTEFMYGGDVAKLVSDHLGRFAVNDNGQTPVLLDFEPSHGSRQFWYDFNNKYRELRPGRVTDFTPEPFKAFTLDAADLKARRYDVRVQTYFGDMSPVDAFEAGIEWEDAGYPREAISTFVDGGRAIPPPIFYEGRKVRNLRPGTMIFSANLLRERGLV